MVSRAAAGEDITITRRGKPVAAMVAQVQGRGHADGPLAFNDMEWLRSHQVQGRDPTFDSIALLRTMRDDYRY
jgi:antitoxin (DNA-binding transcriptional repressor) of toxin-antitoxin stability system